jgi:tetratricopeptide (TPR) repeat protein
MIQPLRATRNVWNFDWFDLDVPIQFGPIFVLPTCLYLVHRNTRLPIAHEFVRELDQRRVELFLHKIFQEKGAPDELLVPDFDEWDDSVWQHLSREYHCQVNLIDSELSSEEEEIENQFSNLVSASAENALATQNHTFIAQGLVRAVKQVRARDKKRALLEKAIELESNLPEAFVELGNLELQEGNLDTAAQIFLKAAEIAEPFHISGHNSQYIKARHGLLLSRWQRGDVVEAISIGEELLSENPKDHSGIRFIVPLLLLASHQFENAREFYTWYDQSYSNDLHDPGFLFGKGLIHSHFDEEQTAKIAYHHAILANLYIAPLLLDLPEPSPDIWQFNERADIHYANEFVDAFGAIWENDASAARFLRETYNESLNRWQKLIEIRQRMADLQDHRYEPDHKQIWESLLAEEKQIKETA